MTWLKRNKSGMSTRQYKEEQEEKWTVYNDVQNAHAEWKLARMRFEEALGQDQIDYAIYMLEAAERKYQMHLKQAKNIGLNRVQMKPREASASARGTGTRTMSR
ncbi:hypothetical protein [Paenibacillus sp. XY044]|uniref:hypothetical protein n=1 Tax=Paenibacillus sp. XY044 TaxID=2026089 RepID=UPI000B997158|nr:hypothetical protein [Paenibacillus sp. XY044]OZB90017.1 hypothetical protein CJP46_35565 [Paenibacillus sp. XY044]